LPSSYPYLRSLSLFSPTATAAATVKEVAVIEGDNDNNNNNNSNNNKSIALINNDTKYPVDISIATEILHLAAETKNQTIPDLDDRVKGIIASLVGSASIRYKLNFDTDEHLAHVVSEIYPKRKEPSFNNNATTAII
jgi:mitochondrial fission protein ELM1